ncbi:hypothetical protein BPO_1635 [Bergeyella porcorum]|uniref:PD-(D/E)XK nuclease superfamily protein n=1 Tax=Bergeyella porcorum TaxID=1735111 RepID=A0AAU0F0Q7_9FLAO
MELINKIKKSPLFQLSLSSRELFHSNFIYWLGDIYREDFFQFWKEKLNLEQTEIKKIDREKEHIDITIVLDDDKEIIVENKVKSTPTKEQLKKYESRGDYFVLLTVFDNREIAKETNWHFISYKDLKEGFLDKIRVKGDDALYHQALINDYRVVIDFMTEIFEDLKKSYNDLGYFDIIESNRGDLEKLRFSDAYLKHYAQLLAENIKKIISDSMGEYRLIDCHWDYEQCKVGNVRIVPEFTNSSAAVSMKYVLKNHITAPIALGVQLQSNQLRFFVESLNKADVLDVAEKLYANNQWHSEVCVGKILKMTNVSLLGKGRGKKNDKIGFNSYGTGIHKNVFVYKYVDLKKIKKEIRSNEIVEIFINAIKYIDDNKGELIKIID